MQLSKAFDPKVLIAQLKAKGIQDADQLVTDELPVIFDWLNTSIAMEAGPYGAFITPVLAALEAKATDAVKHIIHP